MRLSKRRQIEKACITIAVALFVIMTFLCILAVADSLLNWDILGDKLEKFAMLAMFSMGIVVVSAFLISVMINFSIMSSSLERLANATDHTDTHKIANADELN